MTGDQRFHGKHRGIVASNIDPLNQGRLLVQVLDVLADDACLWALPALPVAGQQMGTWALPPVNCGVWVEFEHGDPEQPVWVGCWAGAQADLPSQALAATPPVDNLVLQTVGQQVLAVSDLPGPAGGLLLKSKGGASIAVSDSGITLSNGRGASITLRGSTVTINEGALVIR
jgi:uncharacterized protein involved in type VI secretion and phage assembly